MRGILLSLQLVAYGVFTITSVSGNHLAPKSAKGHLVVDGLRANSQDHKSVAKERCHKHSAAKIKTVINWHCLSIAAFHEDPIASIWVLLSHSSRPHTRLFPNGSNSEMVVLSNCLLNKCCHEDDELISVKSFIK